jgi:hypothetical protein
MCGGEHPSDTVPVLLSPGVSYVSREMVKMFGVEVLKAMNGGGEVVIGDDTPAGNDVGGDGPPPPTGP